MSSTDYYEQARKRVKKRREFYGNSIAWVLTCSFLLFINLNTSPWHLWVIYPFLGWGISVAVQAYEVYGPTNDDWEDREIEREMDRIDAQRQRHSYDRSERSRFPEDSLELREIEKNWDDRDLV
ncbi:MAG: 2TM domain-containing protein [Bacteroidota bacterium]